MTDRQTSAQTNAYAMQYGLMLGIYQCLVLACYLAALQWPATGTLLFLLAIATPALSTILTLRFRQDVGGVLSFRRAFTFTFFQYLYATMVVAIVVFIYFAAFDHGLVASYYREILQRPEIMQQMQILFPEQNVTELADLIAQQPPAVYASNVMITNTLLGVIIAIPTALFCKRSAA